MSVIATAESFLGPRLAREFGSLEAAVAAVPVVEWASFVSTERGKPWPKPVGHSADPQLAASAHVNHGRWLVACPFGCGEHQHASETDRRFFCFTCRNQPVGGVSVPVVWPDERDQVEAHLLARPSERNRNWWPHEAPVDLARENTLHGISA